MSLSALNTVCLGHIGGPQATADPKKLEYGWTYAGVPPSLGFGVVGQSYYIFAGFCCRLLLDTVWLLPPPRNSPPILQL